MYRCVGSTESSTSVRVSAMNRVRCTNEFMYRVYGFQYMAYRLRWIRPTDRVAYNCCNGYGHWYGTVPYRVPAGTGTSLRPRLLLICKRRNWNLIPCFIKKQHCSVQLCNHSLDSQKVEKAYFPGRRSYPICILWVRWLTAFKLYPIYILWVPATDRCILESIRVECGNLTTL